MALRTDLSVCDEFHLREINNSYLKDTFGNIGKENSENRDTFFETVYRKKVGEKSKIYLKDSRRSSFWLQFHTIDRKYPKKSVWSSFKTPYDHLPQIKDTSPSLNWPQSPTPHATSSIQLHPRDGVFPIAPTSSEETERDFKGGNEEIRPSTETHKSVEQVSDISEQMSVIISFNGPENAEGKLSLPHSLTRADVVSSLSPCNRFSLITETGHNSSLYLGVFPSDDRPKWTKSREEIQEEWSHFFRKLESFRRNSCQKSLFTSSDSLNMIIEGKSEEACADLRHFQSGENLLNGNIGHLKEIKRKKYSEVPPNFNLEQNNFNNERNKIPFSSLNAVFGDIVLTPLTIRKFNANSIVDTLNKSVENNVKELKDDNTLQELKDVSCSHQENRISLCVIDLNKLESNDDIHSNDDGNIISNTSKYLKRTNDQKKYISPKSFCESHGAYSRNAKPDLFLSSIGSQIPLRSRSLFEFEKFEEILSSSNSKSKGTSASVPDSICRINSAEKFSSKFSSKISSKNLRENVTKNKKKFSKSFSFRERTEYKESDEFWAHKKKREMKMASKSLCNFTAISDLPSFDKLTIKKISNPKNENEKKLSKSTSLIGSNGCVTSDNNYKTIEDNKISNRSKMKTKNIMQIVKTRFGSIHFRKRCKPETIKKETETNKEIKVRIEKEKWQNEKDLSKTKEKVRLQSNIQIKANPLINFTSLCTQEDSLNLSANQCFTATSTQLTSTRDSNRPTEGETSDLMRPSSSQGTVEGEKRNISKIISSEDNLDDESLSHSPSSEGSSIQTDSTCEDGMVGVLSGKSNSIENTRIGKNVPGVRIGSINYSNGGKTSSPSHMQNNSQFIFPNQGPQFAHLLNSKGSPGSSQHVTSDGTYPYQTYSHQASLEDQGIDVQSPGRSSPGSGSGSSTTGSTTSGNCRNSTTSLDSGRASSSTQTHTHRLSGQSYDSGSILRHSYHSSSSSLGSVEHDGSLHVNVQELLNNGLPDSEVLRIWLSELHFEEYYDKFLSAGYDMPTISRMTPEDLNAIGITKPAHRKKLKTEITKLNISDGLPEFIPSRLEEWLTLLRLDSYTPSLRQQNYCTVEQVTQITWEDLEDVGITKLGHQKKVMLAIKRVKDIMAGKKFSSLSPNDGKRFHFTTQEALEQNKYREMFASLSDARHFQGFSHCHDIHSRLSGAPDNSGDGGMHQGNFTSAVHSVQTHMQYPTGFLPQERMPHPAHNPTLHYRPDVVAVNVRPSGKARNSEEPIYGTYHTFIPMNRPSGLPDLPPRPILPLQANPHPQRSLDDGDITPTNEMALMYEGGATLPRQRTANKYRPVAMVTAKTRADVHEIPNHLPKDGNVTLNQKGSHIEKVFSTSTNNTPQGTPKKIPPPPPKRSNSISESSQQPKVNVQRRGLSYGYIQIKNNIEPDGTTDLPPPPPAPQDRGNHQHLPEDFPPPPPPLTCLTMASAVRAADAAISSSSQLMDGGSTHFCSDSDLEGFRPRRNESNSSFKSTSSTDSGDSLPFANDNAGTIKQRTIRPSFTIIESRSSPRSSPISSPALRRKEGIVHPTLRHPQPHSISSSVNITVPNALNGCQAIKGVSNCEETNDVLSDIGNMLANLTDELDAMLEQELTIKSKAS